jgi:hypothetical protein
MKRNRFALISLLLGTLAIALAIIAVQSTQLFFNKAAFQGGQLGAFFFTWYACPGGGGCDTNQMPFVPPGVKTPYPGDGYYGNQNQEWFNREIADAACAHVDVLFVDVPLHSLITNPTPAWVTRLSNALKTYGKNIRIALYMDTNTSFVNPTEANLCSSSNLASYEGAVNAFYNALPAGNRSNYLGTFIDTPYAATKSSCGQQFWTSLKQATGKRLLLDFTWVGIGGADLFMSYGPQNCSGYVDFSLRPVALVRPGADHSSEHITCYVSRTSGSGFQNILNSVPSGNELTLIESWNELYEGTMVGRGVGFSPQTAYIDAIRASKGYSGSCVNDYTGSSPTPVPSGSPSPSVRPTTTASASPTPQPSPSATTKSTATPQPTTVVGGNPTCTIRAPSVPASTLMVNFYLTAKAYGGALLRGFTAYTGDSNTISGQLVGSTNIYSFYHRYIQRGSYTATLRVTDSLNRTGSCSTMVQF